MAALAAPVKGLRVGVARAPFFDHLDADVATATDAALKTIAVADREHDRRGAADDPRRQPQRRDVRLSRGALRADVRPLPDSDPAQPAERRQPPRPPTTSAAAGRSRRCGAPSTTASRTWTSWCCRPAGTRRARWTPRCEREETDKPRNPELENTGQFNVYGIPAISVPCGFTAAGLPVGLMIAGPRFAEGRVLALAHAFEQATEWHTQASAAHAGHAGAAWRDDSVGSGRPGPRSRRARVTAATRVSPSRSPGPLVV